MTLEAELRAALSPGAVLAGAEIPAGAATDASGTGRALPRLLIRPRDTAEAAASLAICYRHGQSVVPQGGLTGLAGGACPGAGDVALSSARLTAIEEVDADALAITLGAGCILETAQQAAAARGLLFPVDIGARGSATLGGMIATNAGGNRVIRHGMMRDNLLGFEAVLADGTVLSHLNKARKDNTGYALGQLLAGSEGTLAFLTRAVLRLHPAPARRHTAVCALTGFPDVLALLDHARRRLPGLSAFEVMWADYVETCQRTEGVRLFPEVPAFAVILEADSADGEDGAAFEAALAEAFEAGILSDALVAQSLEEARRFWAVREGLRLETALPGLINLDISLPAGELFAFAEEARRAVQSVEPGAKVLCFGHLGDGNLHLAIGTEDPGHGWVPAVEAAVYDTVRLRRGSVSAEHGVGTLKRAFLSFSRSPQELDAMLRIKAALDPLGLMNPGKVLPGARLESPA